MLAELFPDRAGHDHRRCGRPGAGGRAASQAAGSRRPCRRSPTLRRRRLPLAPDAIGAVETCRLGSSRRRLQKSPDLGPASCPPAWPPLTTRRRGLGRRGRGSDGDGSDGGRRPVPGSPTDIYFAVNCLDLEWPESPDELLAAGVAAAREAPHFGEPIVNDYVRCAMWPVEEQPLPAVTAPGAPPILVVSTRRSRTPRGGARPRAARIGVLLTHEGEGHGRRHRVVRRRHRRGVLVDLRGACEARSAREHGGPGQRCPRRQAIG
jgi:hypothetical protein